MVKISILINSYNRESMLRRLISQIQSQIDAEIHVYLDGCEYGSIDGVKLFFKPHHGKKRYYELCQKGFRGMSKADYYFKLDDDMQLVPDFFKKSIEAWNNAPKAVALNLLRDSRVGLWSSGAPKKINQYVIRTGWTDLNFMTDDNGMAVIRKYAFEPPPEWIESSGVARQLSRHLRNFGLLYQVNESLLIHEDHESVMNPNRKEKIVNI